MAQAARLNLRMQKELKLLMTDPPPGASLQLADNENLSSSLSSIEARIQGPDGTAYSGGTFTVRIQVPERYPFQPPNVTFVTPIYHPNIDNGGRVCLDILNLPPKGAWQPSLNISTVLTSIGLLLCEPNPNDGLMAEISREYKYNRQVFDQKARSWTEKYANPGSSAANDLNNFDTPCAVLQPLTDVEKSEAVSGNSFNVSEGSRKKLRLMGQKLSLKSTIAEKKSNDDKENLVPDDNENTFPLRATTKFEEKSLTVGSEKTLNENNNQGEGNLLVTDTIVVSDSEESEEEVDRPLRSRLSLFWKRGAGK